MDCAYNLVLAGFRRQDVGDIPAWRAASDRYYTMVAVKAEKTQIDFLHIFFRPIIRRAFGSAVGRLFFCNQPVYIKSRISEFFLVFRFYVIGATNLFRIYAESAFFQRLVRVNKKILIVRLLPY